MPSPGQHRRPLHFTDLDSAVLEIESIADTGYQMHGNWTLAQVCRHLRLTQDASIDGYPGWMSLFMPLRPLIRGLFLRRLLAGDSKAGIPTSSNFVPDGDLDDQAEVEAFKDSVRRFHDHQGRFHPHPGFGISDRETLERLHAAHAGHHLGFLMPKTSESSCV
ncbi:MAG: DUF1569 domain-containing protein [Planctomycetota bacterium]